MSLNNLFSFPIFLISFIIGIIFVYLNEKPSKTIYVYPTIDNIHQIEYIDKANNCFEYIAQEVQCPNDINKITLIPMQE